MTTHSSNWNEQRSGPQIDYGSTWADADPQSTRQWRVSWDPNTGDLTATPTDDASDTRLLGRLQNRSDVDAALSGWARACLDGEPTAWVANRVSMWFAQRGPTAPPEVRTSTAEEGNDPEKADRLPAEPVARVLAGYRADFGDADTGMFARGLGLDEDLVEDLLAERVTTLDIEQIAAVCEGLWASPYDLWHPDEARTILHAYGPERWPRTILPLDDPAPARVRPADSFIARRLDQQAAEVLDSAIERSATPPPKRHLQVVGDGEQEVRVTAYSITGILAFYANGQISEPSPANIADPDVEYHFQFTRREHHPVEPSGSPVSLSDRDVAAGPPPGQSVHPRLAEAAESLRIGRNNRADMIRFAASDGGEAWVGWDPDAHTWDAWDDPRDHFAGPGEMIIEPPPPTIEDRRLRVTPPLGP